MPSGMLYDSKICVIANGVAFDPEVILQEMEALLNVVLAHAIWTAITVLVSAFVI